MPCYPHRNAIFFYGAPDSPFLAPRGVFLSPLGHLIVSDTGQNRVFIWNQIPTESQVSPDVVIGQADSFQTGRNIDQKSVNTGLQYPSGIWSDGVRLAIADAWNHRVLLWNQMPTGERQPADVVLGQNNLEGNLANRFGVGSSPTADSLYWPYGITSDGQNLWIADTGNRRILHFEEWPRHNGSPASQVLGQTDFHSREYDPRFFTWPYTLSINEQGQMAVADTQSFRVGVWNDWNMAKKHAANFWIGQSDHDRAEPNKNKARPSADTLNWNYHCCFHQKGLWVADTANSRVLYYKPGEVKASYFLGTTSFESPGEFDTQKTENHSRTYWPFCLSIHDQQLAVADTGNHRIILYSLLEP